MKRRNFVKTSGYSLGAVGLASLVSTRGYADDTSGTCPATMTTTVSGTAVQTRSRNYAFWTETLADGEAGPPASGMYWTAAWSDWVSVSGVADTSAVGTPPTSGTSPNQCTYSSPNAGNVDPAGDPTYTPWDADNNSKTPPTSSQPTYPGIYDSVPAGAEPDLDQAGGTHTETRNDPWSFDVVWQQHGPCS